MRIFIAGASTGIGRAIAEVRFPISSDGAMVDRLTLVVDGGVSVRT